jgi:hypothetical protein
MEPTSFHLEHCGTRPDAHPYFLVGVERVSRPARQRMEEPLEVALVNDGPVTIVLDL